MEKPFEAAKYHNKWAVFDKVSRTFTDIGRGCKFCEKKASELNFRIKRIMGTREKTVEEQIRDAELVASLKKSAGEFGESIAKDFIKLNKEEQERFLIVGLWQKCTEADSLETIALAIALDKLSEESSYHTAMLKKILLQGLGRIIKKNE